MGNEDGCGRVQACALTWPPLGGQTLYLRSSSVSDNTGSARRAASQCYGGVRVLYTARPLDDTPPKQQPDEESLGAAWVRLEDLAHLPLRSDEIARVLTEVSQGAAIYPLSVIAPEGSSLLA